ncbi:hypothetical protein ACFQY7_56180 [Actinomadura luteofluorescens]|uniref:hypothetical protein n=1 Tax=Actinomadura luteofluorescens TaxID=46163 RepID=UPI00362B54A0
MDAVTLAGLRKPRPYPAVSVLMPTHRSARDVREDRIRLRNLLGEVRRRLHDDPRVEPDAADDVVRGLERAASEVDPRHGSDALVLFAAPHGEHHAFTIGQPWTSGWSSTPGSPPATSSPPTPARRATGCCPCRTTGRGCGAASARS